MHFKSNRTYDSWDTPVFYLTGGYTPLRALYLPDKKFDCCFDLIPNPPSSTDSGDGFEAARGELVRAGVAAIHGPVEQIDLIWVQFQQEHHHLTTQLMNLQETSYF